MFIQLKSVNKVKSNSNKFADRVIVFENGSIVEDGNITNLMNQDSNYRDLYEKIEICI